MIPSELLFLQLYFCSVSRSDVSPSQEEERAERHSKTPQEPGGLCKNLTLILILQPRFLEQNIRSLMFKGLLSGSCETALFLLNFILQTTKQPEVPLRP